MLASRWFWLTLLVPVLTGACGCRTHSTIADKEKLSDIKVEPNMHGDEPTSVLFDLTPSTSSTEASGFRSYDCSYPAKGRIARFRLQFKQGHTIQDEPIPVATGEGKFVAVPSSDNSALLADLRRALQASQVPSHSSRIAELPFSAVVFGEKMSRNADGSYSAKPPGNWIVIKIFLPKDGDQGQVFLNLNPNQGKGEFSLKDSDYGDYLLTELAKVL